MDTVDQLELLSRNNRAIITAQYSVQSTSQLMSFLDLVRTSSTTDTVALEANNLTMASTAKIPVIDISSDGDQSQVARDLVDAAIEHGFVYIKNTGKDIPVASIDWAFEMVMNRSQCVSNDYSTDRFAPVQAAVQRAAEREASMHDTAEQPRSRSTTACRSVSWYVR